jgi:hypothetical protein
MGTPRPCEAPDDGLAPVRGCLYGMLGSLLVLLAAVVVLAVVLALAGCGGSRPVPVPGSTSPTRVSTSNAPSTGPVDPVTAIFDRAWTVERLGCGLPTTSLTEPLAAALEAEVEVPHLDALIAAGAYVDERCPPR